MSNQKENKICQNCKKDFEIAPEDFEFYTKIKVPPPTFCPECRLQRRFIRRNERTFHYRTCKKCDNKIIAIFSEQSQIPVYCSKCWWSDDWSSLDYGIDFDSAIPVFIQIDKLFRSVPQMNVNGLYQTKVNSDYTHMASWLKNCYMVTYSDYCENVTYGSFINHTKDSVDNLMGLELELCYQTINCNKCYQTHFSIDSENCSSTWFSKNCSGLNDCFGCINLHNKSNYFFNEPYSKEDYKKKLEEIFPLTNEKISEVKNKVDELSKNHPQKFIHGWRNVGSTGDYLSETKNAKNCFVGFDIEDSKFCSFVTGHMTDTYDFVNFGQGSSYMYEIMQGGDQCKNLRMSQFIVSNCQDVDYSLYCISSRDIFGCVGLKNAQYCIFNKQYSKEEYFELREKLITHMNENPYIDKNGIIYKYGEFFPGEISPFGYNETTAQEFFPLTEDEALQKGYSWYKQTDRNYQITLESKNLPETVDGIDDNIENEIIECAHQGKCNDGCSTAFKIVAAELDFYKKIKLPIPELCPNCRHTERLQYRNPMKLWHRKCMNTGCLNEFETSYAPDRTEKVYCESCYNKEIY